MNNHLLHRVVVRRRYAAAAAAAPARPHLLSGSAVANTFSQTTGPFGFSLTVSFVSRLLAVKRFSTFKRRLSL